MRGCWGGGPGRPSTEDRENLQRAEGGLVVHYFSLLVLVAALKRAEKGARKHRQQAGCREGGRTVGSVVLVVYIYLNHT